MAEEAPASVSVPVPVAASFSTPESAWKALCDEKSNTNWILIGLDASKNLAYLNSGPKGLDELTSKFDEKEVQFGAIRVFGVDQQPNVTSRRLKLIAITYVGESTSPVKKSMVLKCKSAIEKLFFGSALHIQYTPDLTIKTVAKTLLAAGGAHKPVFYECADDKINVADLYN